MRCFSKERTRDRVTTIRHDSCILHNKDGDVHVVDWSIDYRETKREREREEGQVRQKGQDTIKPSLHARAPEPFRELARNYRPGTVLAC